MTAWDFYPEKMDPRDAALDDILTAWADNSDDTVALRKIRTILESTGR